MVFDLASNSVDTFAVFVDSQQLQVVLWIHVDIVNFDLVFLNVHLDFQF